MTADAAGDGGEQLERSEAVGPATDGPTDRSATQGRARWGVFFGLAITVLVLDQVSKAWLVSVLAPGEIVEVLGDWARLVFSQNSGALFGLFRDQAIIFGLVSIGVVALIVAYHGRSGRNLYLSIALGLLLGGALGNMTDRLRLGYVVDWIDIGIGDIRWWTFNVADAAVSLAIVMLVALAFLPMLGNLGRGRGSTDA